MEKKLSEMLRQVESKLSVTTSDNKEIWNTKLTDDELMHAIFIAKRDKHFAEKDREKQAAWLNKVAEARRPWTYKELLASAIACAKQLAERNNKTFVLDKAIEPLYKTLALYFTKDEKFSSQGKGFNLNKGLLLMGDPGLGKTDALLSFQQNKVAPYKVITCEEIEQTVREKGPNFIMKYCADVPGMGGTIDTFFLPMSWGFDDLGREQKVFNLDVMPKVIHETYRLRKMGHIRLLPHLCTNYNWQMLEDRYDYTIVSRLKEAYNIIEVTGTDRREN